MHTAQYDSYDSLLSTVSQRVKSALGQQQRVGAKKTKKQDAAPETRSLPRRRVVIPGARATLFDDDDDDDDDEHDEYYETRDGAGADDDWASEDTLGWESADSASLPDEPLVKFRNLSFDLVPIDETPLDPIAAAPAPRAIAAATPHSLRRTIAQLEAEFTSELDKSSMLVDLQYRYMRRRLAHGNGDDSSSATADILSILMEMVRAQTGVALSAEDEESDNAVAGGGLGSAAEEDADDEVEVEESLLDRLREHLERPEYYIGPNESHGGLAAVASGDAQLLSETMVSERSRDFGRFIPTAVPRFGINLHEREE
ncbi:hypothetical protein BDZ88DRAFT_412473 [Geranomyces variabilis]|nr:hypothetical protein BDZ88DRAFT_412473 [Geranomyces variabilis]KAJ3133117.1 hypothetical protein HDU90_006460 [Geranomyces variabilis]